MTFDRDSTAGGDRQAVSFDDEQLILVDSDDGVVGYDTKLNAHRGDGVLHRAFSIILFDGPERVLLQRRSAHKPLWPGFWTNSCCSHPRRGESYATASARRLEEELGLSADLVWLYQFEYSARYGDVGSERELCAVLIGSVDSLTGVRVNPLEIQDWGWFDSDEVDRWIARSPEQFTPWFKLEWLRLRGELSDAVRRHCRDGTGTSIKGRAAVGC
jgi:isopentenyl-diphosphate delta-isomerase